MLYLASQLILYLQISVGVRFPFLSGIKLSLSSQSIGFFLYNKSSTFISFISNSPVFLSLATSS